ncbi:MAG: PAS domain-containing protein [Anaerolineaceae bacterium]
MTNLDYFDEIPVAVTVCDKDGIIVYMNKKSILTFANSGGASLLGQSLLDCHPGVSKDKLVHLLQDQKPNSYTVEKNGLHKMIHQTPWFVDGEYQGFIEFSFEIPSAIPNFVRS